MSNMYAFYIHVLKMVHNINANNYKKVKALKNKCVCFLVIFRGNLISLFEYLKKRPRYRCDVINRK